jgi:LmbE family N-acetylglucosaminyl deacetylase
MIDRLRNGLERCKRRVSCECFQKQLFMALGISASISPEAAALGSLFEENSRLKVLLVVAHPDDESECAAVVYRITHEMSGTVDQIVVTNGEAGHQYSAPARAYYRLPVSEEAWRRQWMRIRRRELTEAGRILGIRNHYFLGQRDTGVTLDPGEGLRAWNVKWIQLELLGLLEREKYELVVVLLPTTDTHGHHQTVALLTLQAIAGLEAQDRPAALGVRTYDSEQFPKDFRGLEEYPLTRTAAAKPVWGFDRRTPLGCHSALDYSIVVNWVIAEHKSQGAFQMEFSRRTHEYFWLFDACGAAGATRWRRFLQMVEPGSRRATSSEEVYASRTP